MDKNYNVDDILQEIKQRKSRERAGGARPRTAAAPPPHTPPPSQQEAAPPPERMEAAPKPPPAREPRPPRRKEQQTASSTDTVHFAPPPRGRKPAVEEPEEFSFDMPEVEKVPRNPLDFDSRSRSLSDRAKIRRDRKARMTDPPPRQEPSFPPEPEEDWQEPPQPEVRETKVIDFAAFRPPVDGPAQESPPGGSHLRVVSPGQVEHSTELQLDDIRRIDFSAVADDYDDYDEDEEDESYVPSASPLDHGEYNSVADRGAVARDIAKVRLWMVIRFFTTAVLTGLLYYVTWAGKNINLRLPDVMLPELNLRAYMLSIVLLSVAVALVGSSSVGGGLIALVKMRANSDTLAALALLAAIGQAVTGFIKPETVDPEAMGTYACVAALAMLFNAMGKMSMTRRIQANFRVISSDRNKRAVLPVQSQDFCRRFVQGPARRPTVAYSVESDFFSDFLSLSYSTRYDVGVNRGVAPACLLGAILVSVLTYLLTGSSPTAVSALTAILCVSATLSSTFIENIPLGKLAKKLTPKGGMVSGNKAVEDFCDTQALVLRDKDLFPEGHIQLHGIKAYSRGRIDEAILDAASVMCAVDSALSPIFLEMIGGNRKLLKKVDNIVYENDMGISAWVNSRRVLIGNRKLMQNHGIELPEDGYERKYAEQNGEAVYLSNSGEVSAQFVISYRIDEELAKALDHMAVRDKILIVHTMDPNLTAHRLWELYGYPEEQIDIMPADLHPEWDDMARPMETATAGIAYTGRASVMVNAILACINARASILAATIIQMVQIALGYGMIAFIAFLGAMSALNMVQLSIYQLFWFLAVFIVQKVRSS